MKKYLLLLMYSSRVLANYSEIPDLIDLNPLNRTPITLDNFQNSHYADGVVEGVPCALLRYKEKDKVYSGSMPKEKFTRLVNKYLKLPESLQKLTIYPSYIKESYNYNQHNNDAPQINYTRERILSISPVYSYPLNYYDLEFYNIVINYQITLPLKVPNPHLNFLPDSFNPELYLSLHPGLRTEAEKEQKDPLEYAKWQFTFYGYNHKLNFLPGDFNPELYLSLHPGLKTEAEKEQTDPLVYAKKQFAFWGWKHNHYLPLDFNPELYLSLHPGLRTEAEKEQTDPLVYAKKQFASWGWKHNHYLPEGFSPEIYLSLNPGLRTEAEKEQMDPLLYAGKQFASWGWKHNHYLPEGFSPENYLFLNPGLRAEAEKEQMDPVKYALKQFITWGWKNGLKYQ